MSESEDIKREDMERKDTKKAICLMTHRLYLFVQRLPMSARKSLGGEGFMLRPGAVR